MRYLQVRERLICFNTYGIQVGCSQCLAGAFVRHMIYA
jgi:hypothetical protein